MSSITRLNKENLTPNSPEPANFSALSFTSPAEKKRPINSIGSFGSPYPEDTPGQYKRLKTLSEEKKLSQKPTPNDLKTISLAPEILSRTALRNGESPGSFTTKETMLITDSVASRCFTQNASPWTKHEQGIRSLDNSRWVGPLSRELFAEIPQEEQSRLPSFVDYRHLIKAGTNGAGFHVCPADSDKWDSMTQIQQSPQGVITARFPTEKQRIDRDNHKFSTFFPTSMDERSVIACIDRSQPLSQYRSLQPGVFLLRDPETNLIIEKRIDLNNPMRATTAYPIFYFGKHSEWTTLESIPLTTDSTLGGSRSFARTLSSEDIQEAVNRAIEDSSPRRNFVVYTSKDHLVLDIAHKLPIGVPKGCYVEVPRTAILDQTMIQALEAPMPASKSLIDER